MSDGLQNTPWHIRQTAYCCFLSDLTGFTAPHCTGPEDRHASALNYFMIIQGKSGIFNRRGTLREEENLPDSLFMKNTQ